ncbi:phage tail assembly chaperone [Burkholderia multivorans]|uniref:phage tail assembly chaperone n=1 Tax=Burkholderia multivorans TaxID=87883 RepID=UPI0030C65CF3
MATEIELNGTRYAIGKLSAMQQFHVSRRIAPIIPPMIPVLMKFYAELEQADVARDQARANAALAALAVGVEGGEGAAADDAPVAAAPAPERDRSRELLSLVDAIAPVLQPFADALAGLKDEDAEYVFGTCLSVVERWQGAGWAKVWNITHKTAMFDDIGIDVMLPLVVRVVVANLGSFISGLLTSQASSPSAT